MAAGFNVSNDLLRGANATALVFDRQPPVPSFFQIGLPDPGSP